MLNKLAINGGKPIRDTVLQYGKQTIDQSDKDAILSVLDENTFLTTGPKVVEFEEKCKDYCGAKYALAVNSGTAALHCAIAALELSPLDEVIISGISFVASANCVVYCNAIPIFCDIEESTMNIDINRIEELITDKTKAIIAVDFAGQLCDYDKLKEICKKHNLYLIQDAAHSWGVSFNNKFVGNMADITTVSFHPVKNMTTCEGGMVFTNNEIFNERMKRFRSHGISTDFNEREKTGQLYSPMISLGYNYRIPDILCALGINQLKRLSTWIKRRNEIAEIYKSEIDKLNLKFGTNIIRYLDTKFPSAYHIFIIKLNLKKLITDRDTIFKAIKAEGIGVNIHYVPIHQHPFYKNNFNTNEVALPVADNIYNSIITLPIYPTMNSEDIYDVINAINKVIIYFKK
jgi:UDP-4-amino-4,6-dideoxy-N-acetyl-beta-L-altrosamine transaminase